MKKILFLLAVFCTQQVDAQPYSISFAGTGLSTVKVENLTTGLIVDVSAGDVLLLSAGTGIPEVNNKKSSVIKVYPNPMTDKSTLEILPPIAGDAIISVCDMTGKVLTQFKGYVENYKQEFNLSGIKNGLHIITVQGNGYQFSEKLLSNGKSNGTTSITRVSNNLQMVAEKKSLIESKGVRANVEMPYNAGEMLEFTAISGNNSTIMTYIPKADILINFVFIECKDGDNNYYPVVKINTQFWMARNLKTTTYRNGASIGTTITSDKNIAGETAPAYQWAYGGNESNVATYGRLYTWYAVTDSRNLCPAGWHVPTDAEWTTLENYLLDNGYNYDGTTTDNKYAKALASTKFWTSSTTTGVPGNTDYPAKRNATGFAALPGGYRDRWGTFYYIGNAGVFWSSTESSTTNAWGRSMYFSLPNVAPYNYYKHGGFSVRCVRDN